MVVGQIEWINWQINSKRFEKNRSSQNKEMSSTNPTAEQIRKNFKKIE